MNTQKQVHTVHKNYPRVAYKSIKCIERERERENNNSADSHIMWSVMHIPSLACLSLPTSLQLHVHCSVPVHVHISHNCTIHVNKRHIQDN